MDSIFHEKQEGSLCAQHCLNALLQGPYFTPIDLAELAQRLDESEREHMAEAGFSSHEYQQFIKQPSSNYDDSGFFSIQVLQQALSVWGVDLEPFTSSEPTCRTIRNDPLIGQAFVCNFREHWLTIRRIGNQWFNLNSLLTGPELLSDTYLSLFLNQLQHEGYSIFIVLGDLPPCEANDVLKLMPAVQPVKPSLISESANKKSRSRQSSSDDAELQRALEESRRLDEDQDESLKRALELSMLGEDQDKNLKRAVDLGSLHEYQGESLKKELERSMLDEDQDESLKRALELSMLGQGQDDNPKGELERSTFGEDQDENLKRALELSMLGFDAKHNNEEEDKIDSCSAFSVSPHNATTFAEPDLEELRNRRLAFLSRMETDGQKNPENEAPGVNTPKHSSTTQFNDAQQTERGDSADVLCRPGIHPSPDSKHDSQQNVRN